MTTIDLPSGPRTRRTGPVGRPPATRARSGGAAGGGAVTPRHARPVPPLRAPSGSPNAYRVLLLLVAALCLIGLVMVLSASAVKSLRIYHSPWHFFERQLAWLILGSAAFALAWWLGPGRLRRLARVAMVLTVVLLLAVLVPGVGVSVSGASRWVGTSSFQLQPSELAKLALVLFAADVLDRRAGPRRWTYQMLPVILALTGLAVLVMAQPDMGTTMVLAVIALAMVFTAGLPLRPLMGLFGVGAAVSCLLAVAAPYRVRRLTSFLNPLADATNTGFQASQGLAALGHGRLLGSGLGSSISSWGYLPNAQTDFIFAVVGEELGLVGSLALTGLFAALAMVGTRIACRCPDRHAALVVAGVTAWVVGQAVINIGAVVGLLPVTGVPLPFVSFGGSSLVIALFGVGLVANAALRS